MGLKSLATAAAHKAGRQLLTVQKHSPVLLFAAGIAGFVTTVVLASRATLKLEEITEETERNLLLARTTLHEDYSEKDRQKDIALVYIRSGFNIAKLYAPAFAAGLVTAAALTGSHVILTRRNTALMAAYAVLDKGFKEYQKRVVGVMGEEKERELRHDARAGEIVGTNPDGEKIRQYKSLGGVSASPYARFFDEHCTNWNREQSYNQMFIQCQQNYANDLLNARGHVFLNDVYDSLGLSRTPEGQIVGWLKNGEGDGKIDFGVYRNDQFMGMMFVNGNERSILLDFNVDGVIWDKI